MSGVPTIEEAIKQLGLACTPDEFRAAFRVQAPCLISFSGGRTSGLMLWCILVAYDGVLPEGVYVAYANTGKEREETLRFVHDCGTHWGAYVTWLEWRPIDLVTNRFEVVGFNSANRDGYWFGRLIDDHNILPNPLVRYCTKEMKIRVLKRFMRSVGHADYLNVVGLRADEMHRVYRLRDSTENKRSCAPLSEVGITKATVAAFWRRQPFDLALKDYEGNCDLCFLKQRRSLKRIIREQPGVETWWIEQERKKPRRADGAGGNLFRDGVPFERIANEALRMPLLPGVEEPEEDYDAECGLTCGGDEQTPEEIGAAADALVAFMRQQQEPGVPPARKVKPAPVVADLFASDEL